MKIIIAGAGAVGTHLAKLFGKVLTTIVDGELRYNGAIIEDQ